MISVSWCVRIFMTELSGCRCLSDSSILLVLQQFIGKKKSTSRLQSLEHYIQRNNRTSCSVACISDIMIKQRVYLKARSASSCGWNQKKSTYRLHKRVPVGKPWKLFRISQEKRSEAESNLKISQFKPSNFLHDSLFIRWTACVSLFLALKQLQCLNKLELSFKELHLEVYNKAVRRYLTIKSKRAVLTPNYSILYVCSYITLCKKKKKSI